MLTDAEKETLKAFPSDASMAEFGALVGMNRRGVLDFLTRNIFVASEKRGRILVAESIRRWGDHLRAMASKNAGAGETGLASERAKLASAQRQEVELRLARARGEYVPLADVVDGWSSIAQIVRSQGLGQASRIGAAVPHLTLHDLQVVAGLMREMLESIAEEVAALAVVGSASGGEMLSDEKLTVKPVMVEVKIPTNRGRQPGIKETRPRAKRKSRA